MIIVEIGKLYLEMMVRCPECRQAPMWRLYRSNHIACINCNARFKITILGNLRLAERIKE